VKHHGRLVVFSLAACIAYTLAYYFDWSLLRYQPGESRFYLSVDEISSGPSILWYGWLALAALAGIVIAGILPPRVTDRLSPDLMWLTPIVLILTALMYEMRWFL
jgi:hypothetical protein